MKGWVLYDGDCGMCTALAKRVSPLLARRDYALAPLQEQWVRSKLALPEDELLNEMRVLTPEGALIGGADAVVFLASRIWWSLPFAMAARFPGVMPVLRAGYRWVAENRGCRHGSCRRPETEPALGWLALVVLTAGVLPARSSLPPWMFMWALAIAIFFGFKWWMYRVARASGTDFNVIRAASFLFLWPGMDARSFAGPGEPGPAREWVEAILRTALGVVLFWVAARRLGSVPAQGWCGMIGLVLILHFGLFHLLSLAWRALGVNAQPLMNFPLGAGSLGDFWGNRWNHAFRQISYELVFAPYHKIIGVTGATTAIFLASGLIHDLVISYPSGGGYGLPTAYFLIQAAGLVAEKSRTGRSSGLGRGLTGRLFAIVIAASPAYWLFHPAFVARVIIPFMKAFGALP